MCLSAFWLFCSHIIISRGPMSPQPREDRMNLGIAPVCAAFCSSLFVGRILPVNPIFHTPTSTQTPPKAGPARPRSLLYFLGPSTFSGPVQGSCWSGAPKPWLWMAGDDSKPQAGFD
ncbi:hypothetical protein BDP81DRAFT_412211 [Colletotrichum phormii]|uniref:Secreted protein n=1 Tax=Colletotrichum phormii TaxID=359342 RepID=A0AAJ0A2D1_9PEZI|nr:uncharacterized protein BDP81DRAFT_412211 [Colletotrichum phormii]KAK1655194.1 hypothetical protein BDP81DRAFT_412211 [Colletotrichum phormii]